MHLKKIKNARGFTLIETIIYLALFAIIIGGGMLATYQVIQSSAGSANHVIMEEEANFLLRKMNWALTGATSVTVSNPNKLVIIKDGTTLTFNYTSPNITLQTSQLNSNSISITGLTFQNTPSGNGVITQFTLTTMQNGKPVTESFSTTKYLRN